MVSRPRLRHILKHSFFFLGLASILWFFLRSGPKPTRAAYPCQQAAAAAGSLWIAAYIMPLLSIVVLKRHINAGIKGFLIAALAVSIAVSSAFVAFPGLADSLAGPSLTPPGTVNLSFNSTTASAGPASTIYVLDGWSGLNGIPDLINMTGDNGLLFYKSETTGRNQGPTGLIGRNDTVLIKVNCQWPQRGGTNTDLVKGLIQAIVDHPDGFCGEVVVVDNGQGSGSFDWPEANAESHSQSIQAVVNSFDGSGYRVSTFLWDKIRNRAVKEYRSGQLKNGYVVAGLPDKITKTLVAYPKFKTRYGTCISLKNGIWNASARTYDNESLKLINVPVLKTHSGMGVTGCLKHYVGVTAVALTDSRGHNIHPTIQKGGMGSMLAHTRFPVLNILDATWVNANPKGTDSNGPYTSYGAATHANVLIAGTDPVAIDYYAAKHVLMPAAAALGYSSLHSMNPDIKSEDPTDFGRWIRPTKRELERHGFQVTMNETRMKVIVGGTP